MEKFIKGVGWLALFIPTIIFSGFVTAELWGWFVVPLGVPAIGIAHALGLRLVVHVATFTYAEDKRGQGERLANAIVLPLFAWAFGAIYHAFLH